MHLFLCFSHAEVAEIEENSFKIVAVLLVLNLNNKT